MDQIRTELMLQLAVLIFKLERQLFPPAEIKARAKEAQAVVEKLAYLDNNSLVYIPTGLSVPSSRVSPIHFVEIEVDFLTYYETHGHPELNHIYSLLEELK